MTDKAALMALADRVEAGEIRALSVKQPWSHYILHDGKDIENRDWPTKGRGWFILHAGKSYDGGQPPLAHADLPRGGVVGVARIVDCVDASASDWFVGKFGFVLRDASPISFVPCRGQLGFFALPSEVNSQVAAALRARAQ